MTTKTEYRYHRRFWDEKTVTDGYGDVFGQPHPQEVLTNSANSVYQSSYSHAGGDLPQWKKVISQGSDAGNNYVAQRTDYYDSMWSGQMKYEYAPYPPSAAPPIYREFSVRGQPAYGTPGPANIDPSVYNTALSSFIPRVNRRITQFSTGQFVGELKETIHGLKHPLQGIRGLLSSYLTGLGRKRGRAPSNRKKRRKFLAEQWLEVSFGLSPLLSDAASAAQAVSRLANSFIPSEHVSSTNSGDVLVGQGEVTQDSHGFLNWRHSSRIIDRTRVRVYGAVRLENSGGKTSDVVGIRTDLFLPTVWELIPYSWLVDYFTNIGQGVEAACFNTSRLIYWGATTTGMRIQETHCHGDATNKNIAGYRSSSFSGGKQSMVTKSITRISHPSLVPSLAFHVPHSYWQWANLLAIGTQHKRLTPY